MSEESQSLSRALSLVDFLAGQLDGVAPSLLAHWLAVSRPTVYRTLHTMERSGYVIVSPTTGHYQLSSKFIQLGLLMLHQRGFNQDTIRATEALTDRVHLVSKYAVWDQADSLIVLHVAERGQRISQTVEIGHRAPLARSSLGRAMMSQLTPLEASNVELVRLLPKPEGDRHKLLQDLQRFRQQGYAVDLGESVPEMACVGAAVVDRSGYPVGAVSVSADPDAMSPLVIEQLGASVKDVAARLSYRLGYFRALDRL